MITSAYSYSIFPGFLLLVFFRITFTDHLHNGCFHRSGWFDIFLQGILPEHMADMFDFIFDSRIFLRHLQDRFIFFLTGYTQYIQFQQAGFNIVMNFSTSIRLSMTAYTKFCCRQLLIVASVFCSPRLFRFNKNLAAAH